MAAVRLTGIFDRLIIQEPLGLLPCALRVVEYVQGEMVLVLWIYPIGREPAAQTVGPVVHHGYAPSYRLSADALPVTAEYPAERTL